MYEKDTSTHLTMNFIGTTFALVVSQVLSHHLTYVPKLSLSYRLILLLHVVVLVTRCVYMYVTVILLILI